MTIAADSVMVRGLHLANVGVAFTEDLAAIKVVRAGDCEIADNTIDDAFFGIYLQEASNCLVQNNELHASQLATRRRETAFICGTRAKSRSWATACPDIATGSTSSSPAKPTCATT